MAANETKFRDMKNVMPKLPRPVGKKVHRRPEIGLEPSAQVNKGKHEPPRRYNHRDNPVELALAEAKQQHQKP